MTDQEAELYIPTYGVRQDYIKKFTDLVTRYFNNNDEYITRTITLGLYPALQAVHEDKSLIEIIRSIDSSLSIFQLNWVVNMLSEYSKRWKEIKSFWDKYQQSLEPKRKTPKKNTPSDEAPDEWLQDYIKYLN